MRLLFVARRYWPAVGGVESFLRDLARELANRHDVTVLAHRIDDGPTERLTDSLQPPPTFEPFDDGRVRVEPLRISMPRRALLTPLATQVVPGLRRYAYGRARVGAAALYSRLVGPVIAAVARDGDMLHMWGSDLVAAAAMRASRSIGVPGVVTPFAHANHYGTGRVDVAAYRAATRVIALLETDAALYRELGVPGERVDVCGVCSHGVPAGHGEWMRRRFSIGGPLVLFLGARRPYKGFDILLQAARLVAASRPGVTFAFAGPGAPLPELDSPARIVDAGVVDERGRAGWLEAADLLCLPSEGEIFPISILEAWSVRTPVLTSDLATLTELVGKARGGVTAPREPRALADTILELLADRERLRAMGDSGYAFWASRHTVERVAAAHEAVYASVTATNVTACAA